MAPERPTGEAHILSPMAVADVGATMWPRNKRRLTIGTVVLAVVVLIAAAVWVAIPPSQFGSGSPVGGAGNAGSASREQAASPPGTHLPATYFDRVHVVGKLAYGMTKKQVLRLIGKPAKVIRYQGLPCWQYPVNEHVPALGSSKAYTLNAIGVCFFDGRYTVYHYKTDGKWDYNPSSIKPYSSAISPEGAL